MAWEREREKNQDTNSLQMFSHLHSGCSFCNLIKDENRDIKSRKNNDEVINNEEKTKKGAVSFIAVSDFESRKSLKEKISQRQSEWQFLAKTKPKFSSYPNRHHDLCRHHHLRSLFSIFCRKLVQRTPSSWLQTSPGKCRRHESSRCRLISSLFLAWYFFPQVLFSTPFSTPFILYHSLVLSISFYSSIAIVFYITMCVLHDKSYFEKLVF